MIDSIESSFSVSPWSRRPAGMPVHAEMTSAMSSAPTRSLTMRSADAVADSACWAASSSASREGISP